MGYPLTTPDDYIGQIAISTNQYDGKDLELFITDYEEDILEALLGCQMAKDLIADLDVDNNPVSDKFKVIWDKFCIDDPCGTSFMHGFPYFYDYHIGYPNYKHNLTWKSEGILHILRYQIYFYYTRDQAIKNTVTGNVKNDNNVSTMVSNQSSNMKRIYNKSIDWSWAVQWYVCKNPESYDYSDYNGQIKQQTSTLL